MSQVNDETTAPVQVNGTTAPAPLPLPNLLSTMINATLGAYRTWSEQEDSLMRPSTIVIEPNTPREITTYVSSRPMARAYIYIRLPNTSTSPVIFHGTNRTNTASYEPAGSTFRTNLGILEQAAARLQWEEPTIERFTREAGNNTFEWCDLWVEKEVDLIVTISEADQNCPCFVKFSVVIREDHFRAIERGEELPEAPGQPNIAVLATNGDTNRGSGNRIVHDDSSETEYSDNIDEEVYNDSMDEDVDDDTTNGANGNNGNNMNGDQILD
ncbi:hypothetical protein SLS60_004653 [Paraconiothyrium brasiliense]|uniref:Uncharacterized protein n=1 Tax=Paraconiothyrium brasiliense TaxID=300254 RepID=A0ABR3RKZ5_9PLEO